MFDSIPKENTQYTIERVNSDLEPESPAGRFKRKNQQRPPLLYPRLACKVNLYQDWIILAQDGRDFSFQLKGQSGEALEKLFSMMDGTRSLSELQQIFSPERPEAINSIVRNLDEQGLIDDVAQLRDHSSIDLLMELEDLTHQLLDKSVTENPFWKQIKSAESELPINVLYGFAIENYHFLCRKCDFDSPVLGFQSSTKVRQLINERYCQEYGQDELLLEALHAIGISREELVDTMPLPQTMALYNALAYWANFEPLFFLSILGLLTTQTFHNFESYLQACTRLELDSHFIDPIRQLVNTKLKGEQANLTSCVFQEILHIERETRQRFRGQIYLFMEMYDNFHRAIWNYYSSASHLLRSVSAI